MAKITELVNLKADVTYVDGAVSVENVRATAAELVITTSINSEVTRAKIAEVANTTAITSASDLIAANTTAINAEVTRAGLAEVANTDAIVAEIARATTTEGINTDAINAEVTRATAADAANTAAINAEVTRAGLAEVANTDAITAEVTRATAAEVANTAAITAEVTRATTAETSLQTQITTNSTGLASEVITRTTNDESLQSNIDVEKARIDAILTASTADTDTFAEVVTLINSVDTTNDTMFAGYVTSNDLRSTTIESNLTQEIGDRTDADTALQTQVTTNTDAITAEVTRAGLAEGNLTFNSLLNTESDATNAPGVFDLAPADITIAVNAEVTRATAAEVANTAAIAAEVTRAGLAEVANTDAITAEVTRAGLAEGNLTFNSLLNTESDATNAPGVFDLAPADITIAVNAEVTRATAAEVANTAAITAEVTRATDIEGDLTTLTTDVKDTIVNSINEVDSQHNAYVTSNDAVVATKATIADLKTIALDLISGTSGSTVFELFIGSSSITTDMQLILENTASVYVAGIKLPKSACTFSIVADTSNSLTISTALAADAIIEVEYITF